MINKDEEDLTFEIEFYEKLLKEKPDYIDGLIALGDAYTKDKQYEKGLEIDKRLSKLKEDDPTVFYNLACSFSLLKMGDDCLKSLRKAIGLGYEDFNYMSIDPDLEFIRDNPVYKELISKYKK